MGGGKKLDKFSGKIEFKNVNFHYPTRPDVKASNFIIVYVHFYFYYSQKVT